MVQKENKDQVRMKQGAKVQLAVTIGRYEECSGKPDLAGLP